MLPKIIPAPSYWAILIYLIPSAILALGVYLRWKRQAKYPPEMQAQAQRGTFWFGMLTAFMTLLMLEMIKLPPQ